MIKKCDSQAAGEQASERVYAWPCAHAQCQKVAHWKIIIKCAYLNRFISDQTLSSSSLHTTTTKMTSKVGQWKPRSRLYEKDLEKDSYFKEIFVEDALHKSGNYRRSAASLEDEQSSTGMSSDGELLEELPEPPAEEKIPLSSKPPHRIPLHQRNVTRIKRSVLQKSVLAVKSVVSALLSFPLLFFFVTMAVYTTGKQQLLDKRKRIQEANEKDMPDELLTQDETYYAERWGYTSEMHEVVTQDGYILKMYRIYKKGSIPRGTYLHHDVRIYIYKSWLIV